MSDKDLKAKIETCLLRKDKVGMIAVGRALVHLRNRQTVAEQCSEQTIEHNGRGFQPAHAYIGTNMANFFDSKGYLSPKQVEYWQKPTGKHGKPRITRYWRQLMEEAKTKGN